MEGELSVGTVIVCYGGRTVSGHCLIVCTEEELSVGIVESVLERTQWALLIVCYEGRNVSRHC